jgi:hypothetical protein
MSVGGLMRTLRALLGRAQRSALSELTTEEEIVKRSLKIANDDELPTSVDRLYSSRAQLIRWQTFFDSLEQKREEPLLSRAAVVFRAAQL